MWYLKSNKSYSFQLLGSWVKFLNVPYHLNWKLKKILYIFKSDFFFCRRRRRINFSDHRGIRGFFVPQTDKKLFQLWLSSVSSHWKLPNLWYRALNLSHLICQQFLKREEDIALNLKKKKFKIIARERQNINRQNSNFNTSDLLGRISIREKTVFTKK